MSSSTVDAPPPPAPAIDPAEYLGLAWDFALPYARRRPDLRDDLIAAAYLGLVEAARRYDGRVKFSTYAGHWIRREILDLLENARMIRIPKYLADGSAERKGRINRFQRDADAIRSARVFGTPTLAAVDRPCSPAGEPEPEPGAVSVVECTRDDAILAVRCNCGRSDRLAVPRRKGENWRYSVLRAARIAGWDLSGGVARSEDICPDCRAGRPRMEAAS